MRGLEVARKFYEDYGADMIEREFPEYSGRIAVGLVGHGSECYGFDDEISRDHDFGIGFSMWLTREDEEKIGFGLLRAYNALIKEHSEGKERISVLGENPRGIRTIEDFYRRYTGSGGAPEDWRGWLYTEQSYFAEAVNGEVFRDDLGEFSGIRKEIRTGMPQDVRLKRLAACALRAAQAGQYNYLRCIAHGETGAAEIAMCEFVKNAAEMIFLLNNAFCPYYKWMFRAMENLSVLGDMKEPLEYLLISDEEKNGKVKAEIADDVAGCIAAELKRQKLADCGGEYLEPYAFDMVKRIKNSQIRNLHILIG